jgi:hypothetical protein
MMRALARSGLTIYQFLQANRHRMARIVNDTELAARFERIVDLRSPGERCTPGSL